MLGCGDRRRSAWISRRLLTWPRGGRAQIAQLVSAAQADGAQPKRARAKKVCRRQRKRSEHAAAGGPHLLDAVELVLHAFDRGVPAGLDALRLEDLRERALALPRD